MKTTTKPQTHRVLLVCLTCGNQIQQRSTIVHHKISKRMTMQVTLNSMCYCCASLEEKEKEKKGDDEV